MIYLHKIIPLITSPLFLALTLLAVSIILRKSKFIKLKNTLLLLSFLTLFLFSNPLISNKLVEYIEVPYRPVNLSEVPVSDYIVVLSGMVHEVKDDVYEWSDPDRFFAGIKLLNANKGKKIKGKSAVAYRGIASVAHQIPINKKIAAVNLPSFDNPSGAGKK